MGLYQQQPHQFANFANHGGGGGEGIVRNVACVDSPFFGDRYANGVDIDGIDYIANLTPLQHSTDSHLHYLRPQQQQPSQQTPNLQSTQSFHHNHQHRPDTPPAESIDSRLLNLNRNSNVNQLRDDIVALSSLSSTSDAMRSINFINPLSSPPMSSSSSSSSWQLSPPSTFAFSQSYPIPQSAAATAMSASSCSLSVPTATLSSSSSASQPSVIMRNLQQIGTAGQITSSFSSSSSSSASTSVIEQTELVLPKSSNVTSSINDIDGDRNHLQQTSSNAMSTVAVMQANNDNNRNLNMSPPMLQNVTTDITGNSGSNPQLQQQQQQQAEQRCLVCGDLALGKNFGVVTCGSCKIFFRRNNFVDKSKLLCRHNNRCRLSINKTNRRNCAACRLRRCIDLGMKVKENKQARQQLRSSSISYSNDQELRREINNEQSVITPINRSASTSTTISDDDGDLPSLITIEEAENRLREREREQQQQQQTSMDTDSSVIIENLSQPPLPLQRFDLPDFRFLKNEELSKSSNNFAEPILSTDIPQRPPRSSSVIVVNNCLLNHNNSNNDDDKKVTDSKYSNYSNQSQKLDETIELLEQGISNKLEGDRGDANDGDGDDDDLICIDANMEEVANTPTEQTKYCKADSVNISSNATNVDQLLSFAALRVANEADDGAEVATGNDGNDANILSCSNMSSIRETSSSNNSSDNITSCCGTQKSANEVDLDSPECVEWARQMRLLQFYSDPTQNDITKPSTTTSSSSLLPLTTMTTTPITVISGDQWPNDFWHQYASWSNQRTAGQSSSNSKIELLKVETKNLSSNVDLQIAELLKLEPVIRINLGIEYQPIDSCVGLVHKETDQIAHLNASCSMIDYRPPSVASVSGKPFKIEMFDSLPHGIFYANKTFKIFDDFFLQNSEMRELMRQSTRFDPKHNSLLHRLYHLRGVFSYDEARDAWAILNSLDDSTFTYVKLSMFKESIKQELSTMHHKYILSFPQKWRQDNTICNLMTFLLIFGAFKEMHSQFKCEKLRYFRLLYLMQRYLEQQYGDKTRALQMLNLMLKLLRDLSPLSADCLTACTHSVTPQVLQKIGPNYAACLLLELQQKHRDEEETERRRCRAKRSHRARFHSESCSSDWSPIEEIEEHSENGKSQNTDDCEHDHHQHHHHHQHKHHHRHHHHNKDDIAHDTQHLPDQCDKTQQ